MRILRAILLIVLALNFCACVNYTSVRYTPEYKSVINQNPEILILPPEAEVVTVEASGKSQKMYDYEYNIEFIIANQLISELAKKGFKSKLLDRKTIYDYKLNEAIAQLDQIYEKNRNELYTPTLWAEEKAFSISNNIGPSAINIGSKTNSKILLVTNYARAIKTSGSRTKDVMMDLFLGTRHSDNADNAIIVIGIIEIKTGRILWTNRLTAMRGVFSSSSNKEEEEKQMEAIIKNILAPLNK
ncbi:MAG: hypothetical protein N4A31_02465 [Rickettsiales bacterium]|jgi:hypothetical protein|nr:hypothetical protein [Rickettsiales bacterium]